MEDEKKLKTLQMFYAGALADAVLRFGKEEVLEKVTAQKKLEQLATGKIRAAQLDMQKPEEVFTKLAQIFGCANWQIEDNYNGFEAKATSCLLCGFAKKLGAPSPCNVYCLDAMEGLVKGIDDKAEYEVQSTLWDKTECRVRVTL